MGMSYEQELANRHMAGSELFQALYGDFGDTIRVNFDEPFRIGKGSEGYDLIL